jgi:AcrR family transcriptional regulator
LSTEPLPPPLAPPGRLERRKARTRAAILDSASRLFQDHGFEETSIVQIAEAADTGVGTLYGYFSSKDEILREVLKEHTNEAVQRYLAAIDENTGPLDRLCLALHQYAQYIRENRVLLDAAFRIAPREGHGDPRPDRWIYNSFRAMLEYGVASGGMRPVPIEVTAATLATTYLVAMLGIGVWSGRENDPATLRDLETMTRALLAI